MALNCQHAIGSPERPTAEPCGICDACTEIRSGSAVDVIEIDAATNRGIDEIRELRDAARYRPARDRYKIYILDEAHQITDAAFNALLKTLEEPPDHVVFMMATTQPEDIPQTIRSRSQHYAFHAVASTTSSRNCAPLPTTGKARCRRCRARPAGRSRRRLHARRALHHGPGHRQRAGRADGRPHLEAAQIRELMGTVPNTVFERLLESVGENNSAAVMTEIDTPAQRRQQPVAARAPDGPLSAQCADGKARRRSTELLQISGDERARVARTATLFSEEDLARFLQIMLRSFDELNYRQEPRFHLELGLLKLVHTAAPHSAGAAHQPASRRQLRRRQHRLASPRPLRRVARPLHRGRAAPQAAPPRSVASSEAARGGSLPRPPRPAQPTFSPFESDTRRKSGPPASP